MLSALVFKWLFQILLAYRLIFIHKVISIIDFKNHLKLGGKEECNLHIFIL